MIGTLLGTRRRDGKEGRERDGREAVVLYTREIRKLVFRAVPRIFIVHVTRVR